MVSINIDNTRISNVKGSVFSTWMSSLGASSNVCDRVNKHMYEWFKYLCVYIINIHILTLPLYVHAGLHRVCKYIWMEGVRNRPWCRFLPQRENFLGLNAGRASWCVAVLSSSIGASSSAEPHFFLEWNNDANFLFLFRSLAWVTWNSEVTWNKCSLIH